MPKAIAIKLHEILLTYFRAGVHVFQRCRTLMVIYFRYLIEKFVINFNISVIILSIPTTYTELQSFAFGIFYVFQVFWAFLFVWWFCLSFKFLFPFSGLYCALYFRYLTSTKCYESIPLDGIFFEGFSWSFSGICDWPRTVFPWLNMPMYVAPISFFLNRWDRMNCTYNLECHSFCGRIWVATAVQM